MKRLLILLLPLALAGCPSVGDDDDTTPVPIPCDNDGPPEVALIAIDDGQPVGFPVDVGAQVTDGDGVSTVTFWYRPTGSPAPWQNIFLTQVVDQPDFWTSSLPGAAVVDPGVDWYVVAKDVDNGCQEETSAPVGAPEQFFTFTTQLDLSPVPYSTDFEVGGADCGSEDVSQLGWTAAIEGFPQASHAWRLRPQSPLSGRCAASHSEGIPFLWACPSPEGDGTIRRKNWLISPPLDLRGKDEVAVRWFERRVDSGPCQETHGLYVSTGSPDPAVGDYQLIADLDLPDPAWGSSPWFDLSEFAGADRLYVGLYYEGGAASRWQVDDFYVGAPLADLVLDSTSGLAPGVHPGSQGVSLDVTLINSSPDYGASDLLATLTTADQDLTVVSEQSTYASLPPGGVETGGVPFVFDVAATHPDDAFLDFALVVEDGAGHRWTVPIQLLMGQESTVTVDWLALGDAHLELELGYGFPASPDFTVATDTADHPSGQWNLTITEHAAVLPPGPGPRRWFLRATNPSGLPATLDGVEFTVGGDPYSAGALDAGPLDVGPDGVVVQIPEPPRLAVQGWSSVPDPVAPGGTVRLEGLSLLNSGSATAGPVSCALASAEADVSNASADPVTFGTSPIAADEARGADGDFSFDLSAGHVDNSPVELILLCSDGAETLPASFLLDVPYAHPVVVGFQVDDSGCPSCNDNGYLDAGEQVAVSLVARNDGAFDTGGPLSATLTVGSGSTADFVMGSPSVVTFGPDPLAVGEERPSDDPFMVSLGPDALMGDSIVIDVVFESAGDAWSDGGRIEAVDLAWLPCPWDDDPAGDVLGSGTIDIKGCTYRSDTAMLQVRMESWTDFDPATAFVDFFFYETPDLYVVESVGGVPDFERDCVFANIPLIDPNDPEASFTAEPRIDFTANTATLRFALADIDALGNNVQVAFGAGSCPVDYFCDLYPGSPALAFDLVNAQATCDGPEFIPINWPPIF